MSGSHKIIEGLKDALAGNISRVEMGAVAWIRADHTVRHAANSRAWAIGWNDRNGFRVRRIVWGRVAARAEKREGERIRKATILIDRNTR